jgi:hypothetical protein
MPRVDLAFRVLTSLAHTRGEKHLLAAFFRAAGLELHYLGKVQ